MKRRIDPLKMTTTKIIRSISKNKQRKVKNHAHGQSHRKAAGVCKIYTTLDLLSYRVVEEEDLCSEEAPSNMEVESLEIGPHRMDQSLKMKL
jgi:hypothetical protein